MVRVGNGDGYLVFELFIVKDAVGPAMLVVGDLKVFPGDLGIIADRLKYRFFGGEPRGEMLRRAFVLFRVGDLLFQEDVVQERLPPAFDGPLDAFNFDDVDAGSDNHLFYQLFHFFDRGFKSRKHRPRDDRVPDIQFIYSGDRRNGTDIIIL